MSKPIIFLIRFLTKINLQTFCILFILLALNTSLLKITAKAYFDVKKLQTSKLEQNQKLSGLEQENNLLKRRSATGEPERVFYDVLEIIDGDTITVNIDGRIEQVRFLGINTPEIENPTECYGQNAKEKLTQLLQNQKVFLLPDVKNSDRDVFDRLLRYVYLKDNTQINLLLLKEGYATYYDHFPLAYSGLYKQSETAAKQEKKGLWESCGNITLVKN